MLTVPGISSACARRLWDVEDRCGCVWYRSGDISFLFLGRRGVVRVVSYV